MLPNLSRESCDVETYFNSGDWQVEDAVFIDITIRNTGPGDLYLPFAIKVENVTLHLGTSMIPFTSALERSYPYSLPLRAGETVAQCS